MPHPVRIFMMILVGATIAWYLYAHGHEFRLLLEFNPAYIPILLIVPFATTFLNALIMRRLIQEFNVKPSLNECYALTAANALGNYLPFPQAGTVARGVYLKKAHGLTYNDFTASIVVTFIQFLTIAGLLGLGATSALVITGQIIPKSGIWIIFGGLTAAALFLTPSAWSLPIVNKFKRFGTALDLLRAHHVTIYVAVIQVLFIFVSTTGLFFAFQSLDQSDVTFATALMITLFFLASGIINVTPGNIGVAEAATALVAFLLKKDPTIAITAYTLHRIVAALFIFTLGPICTAWLTRKSLPNNNLPIDPILQETANDNHA